MQWIRNAGYDVDEDSNSFGNYSDSYFSFSGLYSTDFGKSYNVSETAEKEDENLILSTGAADRNVTNNIYDLAGNVSEFVEGEKATAYGGYYDNISKKPANSYLNVAEPNDKQGFRVVLYHNY